MTDKQESFCAEYLKDFNATKAAVRAGYSPKTAYSIGNENLKKPEIKKMIETKKMEVAKENELSIFSLIDDVTLIKNKCIHENFNAGNALKACDLLSKFLIQKELTCKAFAQSMATEDLEKLARSLFSDEYITSLK